MATPTVSSTADIVLEDECAGGSEEKYELGLHVGSLFIIMFCSLLGTLLPVFFQRFVKHSVSSTQYIFESYLESLNALCLLISLSRSLDPIR